MDIEQRGQSISTLAFYAIIKSNKCIIAPVAAEAGGAVAVPPPPQARLAVPPPVAAVAG